MADYIDPIQLGNPFGYCNTNAGCGVQVLEPNELPLGKINVTYRVSYKYFSKNKPLPYGYVELNIPTYRGGTINGSWGVITEVLNVTDITPANFDDDKNFEDAWKYSQSQLPEEDKEDWEGSFSTVKPKLVAAYNDNSAAELIKNALIQDQTPLIFTPEFANEHAKVSCLKEIPVGKTYVYNATLNSTLNVSCSPGLRAYTRSLGKSKGDAADRILTRIGEAQPRIEGPPTLKEIAVLCDTYVFADNGIGNLRVFTRPPRTEDLLAKINQKYLSNIAAHQKLLDFGPTNLVDIRNAAPNLAGALSKETMSLALGRFQGGGGGGGVSFRSKALYVGGNLGTIGETAIFGEMRIPPLNADATRYDIAIGITLSLGTGADGKPLVEAVRIGIESRHVTIQKGAQAAMRLSVQIVEKIGQLLFSKNKTAAVKAAEAKAAVDTAVANGTITKQQGTETKALIDQLATNVVTPSQVVTNALVGTNPAYRPISDYNGLTFGGLPGPNTNNTIMQGNGAVPTPDGGIVNDAAKGLNNAQTNLIPGLNPGPQTGGGISNNPVPPSLELVDTSSPSPSEIPSNGAQNIITNTLVAGGIAGNGGTLVIRNPDDGTITNVVVDPGKLISQATDSPHVPKDEYQQPNQFMPTPMPGYKPPNVVYVTEPEAPLSPTTGFTAQVTLPTQTTDQKGVSVASDGASAVAPGYGLGGVLQTLPSVFGPMPNIGFGSSSTSSEPGTTNPSFLNFLNSLPQAPDGITIIDEE